MSTNIIQGQYKAVFAVWKQNIHMGDQRINFCLNTPWCREELGECIVDQKDIELAQWALGLPSTEPGNQLGLRN